MAVVSGILLWRSLIQSVRWKAYELGAQRAAIYTLTHHELPSMAFRMVAFDMPDATDEEIDAEAKRRFPFRPFRPNYFTSTNQVTFTNTYFDSTETERNP